MIPRCKTKGCTRACGTVGDDTHGFAAYCFADCMVSKGSRTDSEGGPCVTQGCTNSREPGGRGGYLQHCSRECREGGRRGIVFEEEDGGGGGTIDDFHQAFSDHEMKNESPGVLPTTPEGSDVRTLSRSWTSV